MDVKGRKEYLGPYEIKGQAKLSKDAFFREGYHAFQGGKTKRDCRYQGRYRQRWFNGYNYARDATEDRSLMKGTIEEYLDASRAIDLLEQLESQDADQA